MLRIAAIGAICIALAVHAHAQRVQERSIGRDGSATNKPRELLSGVHPLEVESRLREEALARRPDLVSPQFRESMSVLGAIRRHEGIEQVIPGGDKPGTQGEALNQIGRPKVPAPLLAAAASTLNANEQTSCTREVVRELDDAQRQVRNFAVSGTQVAPDDRLYRLLHKLPGAANETQESTQALRRLEAAWRSVLTNCFTAPTVRPHFVQLAGRIGTFSVPESAPFCSGTLVENGKILTARHCFVHDQTGELITGNLQGLKFTLGDESATLNITDPGFAAPDTKSYKLLGDWIVVNAPPLNKPVSKLLAAKELVGFPEAALSKARPTPLEIFAAVPLAKTLDPVRFPASIVGYHLPGCYVVYKQERCVTHMCNAVPGGSGASIFSTETGDPQWVGIHLGPETANGGSCSNHSTSTNMGLRMNAQMKNYFAE